MKNIKTRLEKVEDVYKKKPVIILAEVNGEEREMTGEEYIANPNAHFSKFIKCGRLEDDRDVVDVFLQRIRELAFEMEKDALNV